MIRPKSDDDEIQDALAIVLAVQNAVAGPLSTAGNGDTNAAADEIDPRRIENALRQLARYRDELKPCPAPLAPESNPRVIGRFEILRELGRGGCGVVFLARDPELSRLVALKVPHPAALVSPELQRRFLIEARAAAGLEHPGIIRVYEVGNTGPISWIASEYCAGCNLQTYLERSQTNLAPLAAAQLVRQLALAIDYAHQRGVLHRDLKPANVLLQGDFGEAPGINRELPPLVDCLPKLTDFGLAKILSEAQDATMTQFPMGTPAYMSPEQITGVGNKIGVASDVYALGVILYELLTGVPPFRGSSRTETWHLILRDDPKPIGLFRADVPLDLQAIVRHATEKKPSERYPSAAELAADLGRLLSGEPTSARPLGALARGVRWVRRHPAATGMFSIAAAALLLLLAGGLWHVHKIEDELETNRVLRLAGEKQLNELRHIAFLRSLEVATTSLAEAKLLSAVKALEESLPEPGETDRRNFVWHHLWNRAHHEQFRLQSNDTVSALAFSPDGKYLAAGEHHDRINIIDLANGSIVQSFVGHSGNVNALVFHGDLLLSAADDGKVFVWDINKSQRVGQMRCHEGDILCMAVHPTMPWIATGGIDSVLRLWDYKQKKLLKEFIGETEWLRGVGFSPDGKSVLSTGHEQRVRSWNIETGELRWITDRVTGKFHALAINSTANTVFIGGHSGVVYEYSLDDGRLLDQITTDLTWIRSLAFNAKKRYLAVSANSGRVRIWRADRSSDLPPEFDFPAHNEGIWAIAMNPEGDRFATGSADRLLKIWHANSDRQQGYRVWDLGKLYIPHNCRVDFQTGSILLQSSDHWVSLNLREFGSSTNAIQELVVDHAHIHPQLHAIAFVRENLPLSVVRGIERSELTIQKLGLVSQPHDRVSWHPDGKRLGVLTRERNFQLWDAESNKLSREYPISRELTPMSLVFSTDGRYAALQFSSPRKVQLLDLPSGEIVWETACTKATPVFSADSRLVAASSAEETIKVFDLTQRREVGHFAGKARELTSLAFTPDNSILAAGFQQGDIQFWDIRTGTKLLEAPTHRGKVYEIHFSPDNRQMLVAVEYRSRHYLCYYANFNKPYPH